MFLTSDMMELQQKISLEMRNKGWKLIADGILKYPKFERSQKLLNKLKHRMAKRHKANEIHKKIKHIHQDPHNTFEPESNNSQKLNKSNPTQYKLLMFLTSPDTYNPKKFDSILNESKNDKENQNKQNIVFQQQTENTQNIEIEPLSNKRSVHEKCKQKSRHLGFEMDNSSRRRAGTATPTARRFRFHNDSRIKDVFK